MYKKKEKSNVSASIILIEIRICRLLVRRPSPPDGGSLGPTVNGKENWVELKLSRAGGIHDKIGPVERGKTTPMIVLKLRVVT